MSQDDPLKAPEQSEAEPSGSGIAARRAFNKRLLFATVITTAILLCLLEGAARLCYRDQEVFVPDPYLLFSPQKNLVNFKIKTPRATYWLSTTSDGFRTWIGAGPVTVAKPPGTYRILCLGDSVTFGNIGISDNETYPYYLQRILSAKNLTKPVQVINGGCMGYSSLQGLEFYRRTAMKYRPDLLIIAFLNNDIHPQMVTDRERLSSSEAAKILKTSLQKSAFYRMLRARLSGEEIFESMRGKSNFTSRVPYEEYRENMEEFLSLASSEGTEVIFLNLPINTSSMRPDETHYRAAVYDLAFCNNAGYIDLVDLFTNYQNYHHKYLFSDLIHPNPEGNEVMASHIAGYLQEKGYLTK
ncbi:MAG: SGNH/GDSL hydrolase family protein [Candidatus Eremiobacteraeota bacterium]|nr:SGNH/GDSL hydrolase family protein [Candidatus Eremiobacteraeota bacterium]